MELIKLAPQVAVNPSYTTEQHVYRLER